MDLEPPRSVLHSYAGIAPSSRGLRGWMWSKEKIARIQTMQRMAGSLGYVGIFRHDTTGPGADYG